MFALIIGPPHTIVRGRKSLLQACGSGSVGCAALPQRFLGRVDAPEPVQQIVRHRAITVGYERRGAGVAVIAWGAVVCHAALRSIVFLRAMLYMSCIHPFLPIR